MGQEIARKQKTGWLFKRTKELSTQGALVTISGDSRFLYRLILTIDSDASNQYPSDLALCVESEKYLPTDVDYYTGIRHNMKAPFRKEVPQNSRVYFEDIGCVMPDVTPMITRCVESTIDSDASNQYPPDLALYVGSEQYLPTDVDDYTGMRHNLKAPFRKEIPQNSRVYLEDIRCVIPDVTPMITRCVESDLRKAPTKNQCTKCPYSNWKKTVLEGH